MPSIVSFVKSLENFFFRFRVPTLAVLLVFTLVMGWLATQLHMTAGFDKQLPLGHEYTDTFFKYRTQLFGANRVTIVVRAKKGDIWTQASLKKLQRSHRSGALPARRRPAFGAVAVDPEYARL